MPPSDPRQEGARRALIVATEQEDAGLLAFQLKKLGLTTMVVANESDALGALAWGTPDIIVIELGSPNVDALHLMVSLGGQRCAAFVIASRAPTADEELTLLRLGVLKLYHRPLDHQSVAERMANAEPIVLPMDNATTASSFEGDL